MTLRHVVVIGAARSGTKLLRDALAEATGAGKVPYDIGYVWRVDNESEPDDLVQADSVDERSLRFIRRFVNRYASGDPPAVIEKTVGNALRVPLVARAFPDAVYIHLIRDGVDVVESARRQWKAPSDLRYMIAKARHFPLRLLPRYGVKHLMSLIHRSTGSDRRVGSWGPRYPGIDDDLLHRELIVVCARQWRYAVTCARADIAAMDLNAIEVRYEALVRDPARQLQLIADFAGLTTSPSTLASASARITPGREGVGRASFCDEDLVTLSGEIGDVLSGLTYERPLMQGTIDNGLRTDVMTETPGRASKLRYRWSHRHPVHRAVVRMANRVLPRVPFKVKYFVTDRVRAGNLPYRLLKPGSVAIQVGAPRDTLEAGRSRAMAFVRLTSPTGRVLVVEPDQTSVDVFRRTAAKQGLRHVEVVCAAAWFEKSTLTIEIDPTHPATNFTAGSVDYSQDELKRFNEVEIDAIPVDDLVDQTKLGRVDVVSVTTNGAEEEILRGLKRTLERDRPIVCLARTEDSFAELMDGLGYELLGEDDRGFTFRPKD